MGISSECTVQYRMHPELPLGQTGDWKSEEARKADCDWGARPSRQPADSQEKFSKWVLECKWNNDKLKRQAEVLAGRNGRRRRWQRAAGSELC